MDRARISLIQQKKLDGFGIIQKLFKNSAVICSSEKIPTGEVDKYQRNLYLRPLFNFDALYGISQLFNFFSGADGIGILQEFP